MIYMRKARLATLPRQDLVVQTGANSYSAGTWLYVRGEILNKGTTDAKFVKVVITLYDQMEMLLARSLRIPIQAQSLPEAMRLSQPPPNIGPILITLPFKSRDNKRDRAEKSTV